MKIITEFQGDYRFLSNFWPASVMMHGLEYLSVEHAYQAAKTKDLAQREKIHLCVSPGQAKRMGRYVTIRPDWERIKLDTMTHLVARKFKHPTLAKALLATGDAELQEGNKWGDTYWGICNGRGENHLGKILMAVRTELANAR
mgnify:CR=1 FL=1